MRYDPTFEIIPPLLIPTPEDELRFHAPVPAFDPAKPFQFLGNQERQEKRQKLLAEQEQLTRDAAAAPSTLHLLPGTMATETVPSQIGSFMQGGAEVPAALLESIAIGAEHLGRKYPSVFGSPNRNQLLTQRAANAIRSGVQTAFPTLPDVDQTFLGGTAPRLLGTTAAFLGGGLLGQAARVPALATTMLTGGAVNAAQGYKEAKEAGADDDKAIWSFLLNAGVGLTEAFPLFRMISRANARSGGAIKQILMDTAEGTTQEALQQTLGNVIARNLYDDDRKILDGVVESSAAGSVTDFLASLGLSRFGNRRRTPAESSIRVSSDAIPSSEPIRAVDLERPGWLPEAVKRDARGNIIPPASEEEEKLIQNQFLREIGRRIESARAHQDADGQPIFLSGVPVQLDAVKANIGNPGTPTPEGDNPISTQNSPNSGPNFGNTAPQNARQKHSSRAKLSMNEQNPSDWRDLSSSREEHDDALIREANEALAERFQRPEYKKGGITAVDMEDISSIGTTGKRALRILENVFQTRVIFYHDRIRHQGTSGVALPSRPDVIFVNFDSKDPIMRVVGHEILHQLHYRKPDLYEELVKQLEPQIKDYAAYERNRLDAGYTRDEVREELMADLLGDQIVDPKFWRKLAGKNPTIFQRASEAVIEWYNKILNGLNEEGLKSTKYFKDIEQVRDTLVDIVAKYGESLQNPPGRSVQSPSSQPPSSGPANLRMPTSRPAALVPKRRKFQSEAQARAAGLKSGDIVYIHRP